MDHLAGLGLDDVDVAFRGAGDDVTATDGEDS